MVLLRMLVKNFLESGLSADTDARQLRRVRFLNAACTLGISITLIRGLHYATVGRRQIAAVYFLCVMLTLAALIYVRRTGAIASATRAAAGITFGFSFFLFLTGGGTGSAYVWSFLFPMVAAFFLGFKLGALATGLFWLLCAGALLIADNPMLRVSYSPGFRIEFLLSLIVIGGLALYYEFTREEADKLLEAREHRFRSLIEHSSSVYGIIGKGGVIHYQSPSLERVFGYEPRELEGSTIFDGIHPGDVEQAQAAFEDLFRRPDQAITMVLRYKHKNGAWREVEATGINLLNDPAVQGIVVTSHDITERKEAERKILALNENLEKRINERTEELRKSEEQLRHTEKMRAVGQLAGGIAHDFNNQLTGIMGCADWLKISLEKDTELYQFAEIIVNASKNAANLTSQLLTFARKNQYEEVPVDIHALISECVSFLKHSIVKSISIATELKAERAYIEGDPHQLKNALLNIALNACDAMPHGGTLTFATSLVKLNGDTIRPQDECVSSECYLKLTVGDTGVGMDEETRKRIFEPFFTTKKVGEGTGMGLAAVYGTIQNHDGAISVDSSPGSGTKMTLLLPLREEASPAQREETRRASIDGAGKTIMVIDDDMLSLNMLSLLLKKWGCTVYTCNSADEAFATHREHGPAIDLILLDLIMPGKSSTELFDELKSGNPDVRVILSSGYAFGSEARQLLDKGALSLLRKPYDIAQLAKTLSAGLGLDPATSSVMN
ncbi:MAG: PAS domain S-box protein [Chitinivibrionales bacterium]|nr:PAS domain S-box protein [Chitinivibrionales bacterium]